MQHDINKKIFFKNSVGIAEWSEWQVGPVNFKCLHNSTGATIRYMNSLFCEVNA
jgi:hypothetical protein